MKLKIIIIVVFFFFGANSVMADSGCNFGITNTVIVNATHSYTITQGPWGVRKYVWNWGDGTKDSSYTNPANQTWATHTYSNNGVFTMNITACDSASGAGCISYGNFPVSVSNSINMGLNDLVSDLFLQIFPNPVTNELRLRSNEVFSTLLMNLVGMEVPVSSYRENEDLIIDMTDLNAGIYFLYVYDEKKRSLITKIVKRD